MALKINYCEAALEGPEWFWKKVYSANEYIKYYSLG